MKNRKTVVVAFLLVAVMLLGVGYAALTDNLTITGFAQIDDHKADEIFDSKVYFKSSDVLTDPAYKTSTGGSSTKVDSTNIAAGGNEASFTAHTLAAVNEYVSFKFEIYNDSNVSVNVSVTSETETDTNDAYLVTYRYFNDANLTNEVTDMTGGADVASKSSLYVLVKVLVNNPVTSAIQGEFKLDLHVTTN